MASPLGCLAGGMPRGAGFRLGEGVGRVTDTSVISEKGDGRSREAVHPLPGSEKLLFKPESWADLQQRFSGDGGLRAGYPRDTHGWFLGLR